MSFYKQIPPSLLDKILPKDPITKTEYLLENYNKYKDDPVTLELLFKNVYRKNFRYDVIHYLMSLKDRWAAIDCYVGGYRFIELEDSVDIPFQINSEDVDIKSDNCLWTFIIGAAFFILFLWILKHENEDFQLSFNFFTDNFHTLLVISLTMWLMVISIIEFKQLLKADALYKILQKENKHIN